MNKPRQQSAGFSTSSKSQVSRQKPSRRASDNTTAELNQKSWKCFAITLDPEGERYQTFLENNNHLQIETFQGIIGRELTDEAIINQGLATSELVLSQLLKKGAIGCSASHKAIWDIASEGNVGYFILEDDCYTHPKAAKFINDNLSKLMNSDICFFGINTDSILLSTSPQGLVSLSLFDPKYPSQAWIKNALSQTTIEGVMLHRVFKAFGYCAYFISPSGAKRLSQKIFPLSTRTTQIPLITDRMPAIGLDRAANGVYSEIQANVCQPF